MNTCNFIGNLVRDPKNGTTNGGVSFARFSIAVARSYSGADGKREVDFLPVVAWRGLADNVAKFCKKGSKVAVTGALTTRNYEDKSGNKRTAYEILAERVEFLPSAGKKDDDVEAVNAGGKAPTNKSLDDDGDLPF